MHVSLICMPHALRCRVRLRAPDQVDQLVSTHGVPQDTAQRYLTAANNDLPGAHRLLQTSRVRSLTHNTLAGCTDTMSRHCCNFICSCRRCIMLACP
jgi:hypothetical protein